MTARDLNREDALYAAWIQRVLVVALSVVAAWLFVWPVYRAFLDIEIDCNEGWNAALSDLAIKGKPLYPPMDQLVTNNYPPLSFYIVGGLGRLLGDPILAGRLLSLVSVLAIAAAIFFAVRKLGGDRLSGWAAAVLFVGTMSRFATRYVGMDDPQLLAHAVMAFGFVAFLSARERERGFVAPILIMVAAGFIKHNIIAMPLTAMLWLALHRPREAVKCFAVALGAITAGFGACYLFFGRDFFTNMMSPRQFSWESAMRSASDLKYLRTSLAASVLVGAVRWRDSSVRLCGMLIGVALVSFFLQKTGAGVDVNAMFDLVIAASIGAGLALAHAPTLLARLSLLTPRWEALRIILLLAMIWQIMPLKRLHANRATRLFLDRSFQREIATREQAMARSVAEVRDTPGDVVTSTYVSYRAGKGLAVDQFNLDQRIHSGALPHDVLEKRVRDHALTFVDSEGEADWDYPLWQGND